MQMVIWLWQVYDDMISSSAIDESTHHDYQLQHGKNAIFDFQILAQIVVLEARLCSLCKLLSLESIMVGGFRLGLV